ESPYIARVVDTGVDRDRGLPFLVMPLLRGKTLLERLRMGPMWPSEVSPVWAQLAQAMDQAHRAGVIHCDLQPSKLFLTNDEVGRMQLKVLDFGIARLLLDEAQRTGTEIGTPYSAPEQLPLALKGLAAQRGVTIAATVSPQTDVWALGLIVYETFTGYPPLQLWGIGSVSELPLRVLGPTPQALAAAGGLASRLPRGFQDWLARCLERDASQRWPSFGAAVQALQRLLADATGFTDSTGLAASPGFPATTGFAVSPGFAASGTSEPTVPEISVPQTWPLLPAQAPSEQGAAEVHRGAPAMQTRNPEGQDAQQPPARQGKRKRKKEKLQQSQPRELRAEQAKPTTSAQWSSVDSRVNVDAGRNAAPRKPSRVPQMVLLGLIGTLLLAGLVVRLVTPTPEVETGVDPVAANSPEPAPAETLDGLQGLVAISSADPMRGPTDAAVTIVEVADFQCPFSARVQATLQKVADSYKDQVRIVYKHDPLPFHPRARPAADAASTVFSLGGNSAFWNFHDKAFANQSDLSDENFETWAEQAGVRREEFRQAYAAKRFTAKVDADLAFCHNLGISGTPNFRINGIPLLGAQPFEKFQAIIDAELAETQKLLAEGVAPSELYSLCTKANSASSIEQPKTEASDKADTQTVWKVPVRSDDPQRGPRDALVTIVEYADFQCPFSVRVATTVDAVLEEYPKDVRIVWKDYPLAFHAQALPAATMARFVYERYGNASFWKAHDALFASALKLSDEDLLPLFTTLGLSWTEVQQSAQDERLRARIKQSMDVGEALGVKGTPSFFINGVALKGAQPLDVFKSRINDQLAKARALVAGGVAASNVYEELTKSGLEHQ
ncbi:MAG TPA: thioredoxin domain-containing protein, partial [Polyangiaceae bacterium]|nr:thioredoxin domain-containing protein [Polyangiaceae bacterium]